MGCNTMGQLPVLLSELSERRGGAHGRVRGKALSRGDTGDGKSGKSGSRGLHRCSGVELDVEEREGEGRAMTWLDLAEGKGPERAS